MSEILKSIELSQIESISLKAGKAVLEIYEKDFQVEYKEDKSPLTEADIKANEIICSSLKIFYPDIPILSEENKEVLYENRKNWEYYWCIDPIDGTKEFIKKNGQFTVNIALIQKDKPVLGVVYAPVLDKLYSAKKGKGAFLNYKTISPKQGTRNFTVVASNSHKSDDTNLFIEMLREIYPDLMLKNIGSSLKLCMVAEGKADIYPRMSPTTEWDTAAAHAIVLECGKNVYIYDEDLKPSEYLESKRLKPLVYNKQNLLNPYFVVV